MIFAYIDLSNSRQRISFYDSPQGRSVAIGECERVGQCGAKEIAIAGEPTNSFDIFYGRAQ